MEPNANANGGQSPASAQDDDDQEFHEARASKTASLGAPSTLQEIARRLSLTRNSGPILPTDTSIAARKKLEGVVKIYKEVVVQQGQTTTINLVKYVEAYSELLQLMQLLGKLVGIVTRDLEQKVTVMQGYFEGPTKSHYQFLDQSIQYELDTKFIKKNAEETVKQSSSKSATRNMIRLHNAMEFMLLFFTKLQKDKKAKVSTIVNDAYRDTLSKWHSWFIRNAASVCFYALPSRRSLVGRLGYNDEDVLSGVMDELTLRGNSIFKVADGIFKRMLNMDKFK